LPVSKAVFPNAFPGSAEESGSKNRP